MQVIATYKNKRILHFSSLSEVSDKSDVKVLKLKHFNELDDTLLEFVELTELYCNDECQITSLPENIGNSALRLKLKKLDCSNNLLTSLPESICNLEKLESLNCSHNRLTSLPENIGNSALRLNLKEFDFYINSLTSLPESICNLEKLESLSCSFNLLTSLPENIGNSALGLNLKELLCRNNLLSFLPESICNCINLKKLYLNHNAISSLPENIGSLVNLTLLGLYGNKLTALPESIINLTRLQYIVLDRNEIIYTRRILNFVRRLNDTIDFERMVVYDDTQNTHNPKIVSSIKSSIETLMLENIGDISNI